MQTVDTLAWNFQFTTSQGGRPPPPCQARPVSRLSIHDLTRRSTVILTLILALSDFQFTTSQGGRQLSSAASEIG